MPCHVSIIFFEAINTAAAAFELSCFTCTGKYGFKDDYLLSFFALFIKNN